jgi:hypothetical protein
MAMVNWPHQQCAAHNMTSVNMLTTAECQPHADVRKHKDRHRLGAPCHTARCSTGTRRHCQLRLLHCATGVCYSAMLNTVFALVSNYMHSFPSNCYSKGRSIAVTRNAESCSNEVSFSDPRKTEYSAILPRKPQRSQFEFNRKFKLCYRQNCYSKGKGKDHPITSRKGPKGVQMYNSTLSLTSPQDWLGVLRHAPAALPPGKARYPLYRRLGGPQDRSGRVRKNFSPHRDSNARPSSP